jgi:hypothetical protein
MARAYLMTGRQKEFDRLLAANRRETSDRRPYHLAIVYAGAGDKVQTFEALDQAADVEPERTAAIILTPEMKFLVGDPRHDALKRKLGLPLQRGADLRDSRGDDAQRSKEQRP